MVMGQTQQFTDKDMAQDALTTQKQVTSSYNTFLNETSSPDVRQPFMQILQDEHQIESQVFDTMSKKGWYSIVQADQQQIQQTKQKYTQTQSR